MSEDLNPYQSVERAEDRLTDVVNALDDAQDEVMRENVKLGTELLRLRDEGDKLLGAVQKLKREMETDPRDAPDPRAI